MVSFASTIDLDDTVLGLRADGDMIQELFVDAEFLGDCSDDGDGGDLVALHVRSGGGRDGCLFARGPPIPGEQFVDTGSWVAANADEHICQPGLRVIIVHLAGDDQTIDSDRPLSVPIGPT